MYIYIYIERERDTCIYPFKPLCVTHRDFRAPCYRPPHDKLICPCLALFISSSLLNKAK